MYRVVAGLAFVLWSSVALADEATAKKKYAEGESAYNLGEFDKAVELFKEAYAEWPEPAFLFNIGQTYRQAGDCKQALFFYKRYLALKQNDTRKPLKPEVRAEVEKRIVELDECIKRELADKPPDQLDNGTTSTTGTATTTGTPGNNSTTTPTNASTTTAQLDNQTDEGEEDEGEDEEPTEPNAMQPTLISARIDAGAGKLTAGELDTPIQFAAAIIGGYPLAINEQVQIELGAAVSFTPVPYTTTSGDHGSGALIGVLANVAPSYMIIPKLAARLDVGAGVLVFSGLGQDGNPFTTMGVAATGPLSTLHVRAAVSADYAVTPNLVLTATPVAFGYSPAPSGFDESISSLSTLSFMAGVSYRR